MSKRETESVKAVGSSDVLGGLLPLRKQILIRHIQFLGNDSARCLGEQLDVLIDIKLVTSELR